MFVCLCPDFIYPLYRLSRAVFPHKGGTGGTQLGRKMCAIKIFKSFTDRKATSCAVLSEGFKGVLFTAHPNNDSLSSSLRASDVKLLAGGLNVARKVCRCGLHRKKSRTIFLNKQLTF